MEKPRPREGTEIANARSDSVWKSVCYITLSGCSSLSLLRIPFVRGPGVFGSWKQIESLIAFWI